MPLQPQDVNDDKRSAAAGSLRHRLQAAIDKVGGYHERREADVDEAAEASARPLEEWSDIVSQRIEDAMRQGLFDNLAGRGKPLSLDRDPFLPEDRQMAATLLRNNNLSPEWISERKAILAAVGALRAELRQAAHAMEQAIDAAPGDAQTVALRERWTRWLADWQTRLGKLNDRILVHNLKQPIAHLEILQLRLPDELTRAGAEAEWSQQTGA